MQPAVVNFSAKPHSVELRDVPDAVIGEEDVLFEVAAVGKTVVVIVEVEDETETDLAEVRETTGLAGFLFGASEGGEEHAGKNRNDGDDDEQLDQSKGERFGGAIQFR